MSSLLEELFQFYTYYIYIYIYIYIIYIFFKRKNQQTGYFKDYKFISILFCVSGVNQKHENILFYLSIRSEEVLLYYKDRIIPTYIYIYIYILYIVTVLVVTKSLRVCGESTIYATIPPTTNTLTSTC